MSDPPDIPAALRERASRIDVILLDADGVLTDGRLYYADGGGEAKAFDARDGHGIRLGQLAGLRFGIVSGRASPALARRAAELDIVELHQRIVDKLARTEEILQRLGVGAERACFVGDDLIDLPVMRRVGLAVAPADAVPETRQAAHYVTERRGGRGAVREVVELVLRASGRWADVIRRYGD